MLAYNNRFENLPEPAMGTVITFLATNAHEQHQRAITEHILLTEGSPLRVFTYFTNGLAGNISVNEDILDHHEFRVPGTMIIVSTQQAPLGPDGLSFAVAQKSGYCREKPRHPTHAVERSRSGGDLMSCSGYRSCRM